MTCGSQASRWWWGSLGPRGQWTSATASIGFSTRSLPMLSPRAFLLLVCCSRTQAGTAGHCMHAKPLDQHLGFSRMHNPDGTVDGHYNQVLRQLAPCHTRQSLQTPFCACANALSSQVVTLNYNATQSAHHISTGSAMPLEREMKSVTFCAGSLLWMLAAPSHPDYDGYTVYNNATNYGHNPQPLHPLPPAIPPCNAAPGTVIHMSHTSTNSSTVCCWYSDEEKISAFATFSSVLHDPQSCLHKGSCALCAGLLQ